MRVVRVPQPLRNDIRPGVSEEYLARVGPLGCVHHNIHVIRRGRRESGEDGLELRYSGGR